MKFTVDLALYGLIGFFFGIWQSSIAAGLFVFLGVLAFEYITHKNR